MTGKPVFCRDASRPQGASQTRSSDYTKSFNVEIKTVHDRKEQPVVCHDASFEPSNEHSVLIEVDIDFRISGLPHSVVKPAQNSRVRECVKMIKNLTDNLFNAIYNESKRTTRSVR